MKKKVEHEIVLPDEDVSRVVGVIEDAARTGVVGDGKIFVISLGDAVRIRTGEHGPNAV